MRILCLVESGLVTRTMLVDQYGVSARTLTRRLARARFVRDDIVDLEPAGGDDTVHLEVSETHASRSPGGDWYCTADDEASVDRGEVLITDGRGKPRLKSLGWGGVRTDGDFSESEPSSNGKPKPTSYKPHPRLKGGL